MENTEEWLTRHRPIMVRHAFRALQCGFTYKGHRHYFPQNKYDNDLRCLAHDAVQQACSRFIDVTDDKPQTDWLPVMLNQVTQQILTVSKSVQRGPLPISISASLVDDDSYGGGLKPLDLPVFHRPTPEQELIQREDGLARDKRVHAALLILAEWRGALTKNKEANIAAVERAIKDKVKRGSIRNPAQVKPFIEVIRHFFDDPTRKFDSVRQEVASRNRNTPGKAQAQRWWAAVRADLPMPLNEYTEEHTKLAQLKEF